jgi:hypothetical protein
MKLVFLAFTDPQHMEKNFSARHGRLTPGASSGGHPFQRAPQPFNVQTFNAFA